MTEDGRRREFILNVILIGSITLLVLSDLSLLYNVISRGAAYSGVAFSTYSSFLLLFVLLYALSRRRFIRLASFILIGLYFLGASYSSYTWGVSLPAVLLIYALIITLSSVLISSRFGVAVALIIYATLTVIGKAEIARGVLPAWKSQMVTLNDVLVYSTILFLITLISWLSNREIDNSLKRARRSEAALLNEKALLEIKVEERTRELREAQAEKMSQLSRLAEFGRLSSGLFHDLVSPLSTVSNSLAEIEHTGAPDLHGVRDQLDRAIRASKRMDVFISSIKKQIRSDEFEELFSVRNVIEEAVSLFHYRAMKHNITIDIDMPSEISLFGNPIKFHQILTNLISNALDAYDDLDPLDAMHISHAGQKRAVHVNAHTEDNLVTITVTDHGVGIPTNVLPRIFDQFFTTKSHENALGLGLSTTKEIVEKEFGGIISVVSNPLEGTRFSVHIPHEQHNNHSGTPRNQESPIA